MNSIDETATPALEREAAPLSLAQSPPPPPQAAAAPAADAASIDGGDHASRSAWMLGTIVVAIIVCACFVAQAVIVPIIVAALFGLIFAPAVRLLERWHVPRALGAFLAVTLAVALLGGALAALAAPARQWMARIPLALVHVDSAMRDLRRPLQAVVQATHDLGKLANFDGAQAQVRVVDASPGLFSHLVSVAPGILASAIIIVFLMFLFLLHGDELLRKFVTLAPHLRAKRELVTATRQAQHELSLYMITITAINACLGIATAGALWFLHVPDPALWGGVAAILNFAPFIGPLLTALALCVAGFAEFASPISALAAPGAFLALHLVEGQLVTPHLVGRRLALDPVVVFLALILLGWLWGVAGLLLAVPLLSCAKIIASRIPEAHAVTTLLSR